MKPRVLINCPGGWSHGLDSPERGEGRWAQNLARVLGRSGRYEVFACSGGNPTWGRGEVVSEVTLLSEPEANQHEYDVYIDSSWWDGKSAVGRSRANLHARWGFEDDLRKPFAPGHFLVYVYRQAAPIYLSDANPNRDRTLYLPGAFGPELVAPNPAARRVIHTLRGMDGITNAAAFEALYEAITRLRRTMSVPFAWLDSSGYARHDHPDDRPMTFPPETPWGIPYCELLTYMRGAGLNATLDGVGNLPGCAILGVPSLLRADRTWDFIAAVGRAHGVLLPTGFGAAEIADVIGRLYADADLYVRYTRDLQGLFTDHLDSAVLARFDEIVKAVL